MTERNNIIYKFIWKDPDRIPREAMEHTWNEGGVQIPQPQLIRRLGAEGTMDASTSFNRLIVEAAIQYICNIL